MKTFNLEGLSRRNQGTIIAEPSGDGEYILLFPNGDSKIALDRDEAERFAKRWFARDAKKTKTDVGVGRIEWRTA